MSDRSAVIAALSSLLERFPGSCVVRVEANGKELAKFDLSTTVPITITTDPCKRAIYETIRDVGHRLTTMDLLEEMDKRGSEWSERTVKEKLSEMVDDGTLDNDQRAKPKGYGITSP